MPGLLPLVVIVAAVLVLVVIYRLLMGVTAQGGASDQDAAATANQILGEADAFRGSRSSDDPAWDGHNRLAPPTQEGGA
ncbi:MAG TPA: hypothetical protein VMS99_14805 [Acidimicrobiia bacterium]|nr:hypothetical protein [Acidimicrobiia bacterium]